MNSPIPSWEFYDRAPDELMPKYRVEIAKSGRSRCKRRKTMTKDAPHGEIDIINRGELRCGSLLEETGSYTRWHHLDCWRIPSQVWLGFPKDAEKYTVDEFKQALSYMNSLVLSGFSELSDEKKIQFVTFCMNRDNWARLSKKKKVKIQQILLCYMIKLI